MGEATQPPASPTAAGGLQAGQRTHGSGDVPADQVQWQSVRRQPACDYCNSCDPGSAGMHRVLVLWPASRARAAPAQSRVSGPQGEDNGVYMLSSGQSNRVSKAHCTGMTSPSERTFCAPATYKPDACGDASDRRTTVMTRRQIRRSGGRRSHPCRRTTAVVP